MPQRQTVLISDFCYINSDSYSGKDAWEYVNYLDTGNITKNNIDEIQFIDLTDKKLPSRAKRKVKYNSIIYSTVRPNQHHYGIIKGQPENFLVSTGFTVIDVDDNIADADYIYYWLTQPKLTEKLQSIAEQSVSAYPSIKASDIEELEIELPLLEEQKRIASILSSLDNKRQANSAINRNLSEQSQMIVKAYMDKKAYEMKPLSVIADVIDCLHSKKPNAVKSGTKQLIQLDNITDTGFLDLNALHFMISDEDYEFWTRKCEIVAGDCVITNVGRVGAVSQAPAGTHAAMGRNMTCIRLKNACPWHSYIITLLLSDHMKREITKNTDVGTIMNALNVKDIPKLLFPIFSNETMQKLEKDLQAVRGLIEGNYLENQRLSLLRDALLPKLMSGEIDASKL